MKMLDSTLLNGRVILVSGATQGLGSAVAVAAAAHGAEAVAVSGRNAERGAVVVSEIEKHGAKGLFIPADLTDEGQARETVRRTVAEFGRVDGLANVAGLAARSNFLDVTSAHLDEIYAINFRAPLFVMQEAIADMVRREMPGNIVNILSMASYGGNPNQVIYSSSKAALAALTRNNGNAFKWKRIRVNGLNLGWTDTPGENMIQRRFHDADDGWEKEAAASLPMGKMGQPDEHALMVIFLLSELSGVVTGAVLDWDQEVMLSQED